MQFDELVILPFVHYSGLSAEKCAICEENTKKVREIEKQQF